MVPKRFLVCGKENKMIIPGKDLAKFWTEKRERAKMYLHRAQAQVAGEAGFLRHEKRSPGLPCADPKLTGNSRNTGDFHNPLGF